MSIEMSSSARLGTGNRGRSVNGIFMRSKERLKSVNYLENWRKFVLFACVFALAIDPLFLFIPQIDSKKACLTFDENLGIIASVVRTFIDTFYVFHFMVYLIIEIIVALDRSPKNSSGELSVHAARKRLIPLYLILDILSVFPVPQIVVFNPVQWSTVLVSKKILKWVIVGQYIPRIIRIYPLYKEVTRTSGTIAESNWIGATLNLFLFMLFSYVFGAFWYVTAIEKQSKCWHDVCIKNITSGCDLTEDLFCPSSLKNTLFLNTSCPLIDPENITKNSPEFDFGMYIDVLKSGVGDINPRDFPRKFVYCFWWGLRHLSTFAQSLKPGNSATDISFAIIICVSGLFLFAVLIGNVQKYMISTTVRVEEMKERQRDTEKWMSSRKLPKELRERIRKHDNYKWREFRGTEEDALLLSLPKDLRLETKRYLYLNLLKKVTLLGKMDDWVLEAVCDRVKSVFYSKNRYIVKEGHPVEEMLIVTKGILECNTKSSERADHYDTSLLKEGDICGDLDFWILNPSPPHLPISNRTVMTVTDVEGFILLPDDLKFVASHLDRVQTVKDQEIFRSLSDQGRPGGSSSPDMLLRVPQRSDDPVFSKDYNN